MRTQLTPIDAASAQQLARAAGVSVPVEQSAAWERFDEALPGREPWHRLVYREDGVERAILALTRYRGRGFVYLWAKHGPVWLSPERPSAPQEARLRGALVRSVRTADPLIVFVRLHAWHRAPDTRELLQTMPIERTVVVPLVGEDGAPLDDDALMASFKKRGRRDLRKGLRENPLEPVEETAEGPVSREVFGEMYDVLRETADRDDFGINDEEVYWAMLTALGPETARVFLARDDSGAILAWNIITVHDGHAVAYYGASTHEGRRARAPEQLYWHILRALRDEGIEDFDFLGVDSERAPRLAGVAEFKRKFSEDIVDVAGAWDVPVLPRLYAALVAVSGVKRSVSASVRGLAERARTLIASGGEEGCR